MGSGTHLMRSQKKHGIENFTKEILHVYDTPDEMYNMKSELVNEEFVKDPANYNLTTGGQGGFPLSKYDLRKGRIAADKVLEEKYGQNFRAIIAKKGKDAIAEILKVDPDYLKRTHAGNCSFLGKNHTEETKSKMSKSAKERLKDPTNNSQYGTMWITDGTLNKKIKKGSELPDGWKKGRIVKSKVK